MGWAAVGGALIVALSQACSPGRPGLMLEVSGATKAVLLAIETPAEGLSIQAFAFEGSEATVARGEVAGRSGRATLLLYRRALSELDIPPGRLTAAAPGDPAGVALPKPDEIMSAALDDEWSPLEALPASLSDFRMMGRTPQMPPCDVLASSQVVLSSTHAVQVLTSGPQLVLAATAEGALHKIELDAGSSLTATGAGSSVRWIGARSRSNGDVWLGAADGRLFTIGGVEGSTIRLEHRTTVPDGSMIDFDLAYDVPLGLDLFALAAAGRIHHFDGSSWALLHDGAGESLELRRLIRTPQAEGLAIGPTQLIGVSRDRVRRVPLPGATTLTAIGLSLGGRPILGAREGEATVFLELDRTSGALVPLAPASASIPQVTSLANSPSGFDFVTTGGHVGRFVFGQGACPLDPIAQAELLVIVDSLPRGAIAAGRRSPGDPGTAVYWLSWHAP